MTDKETTASPAEIDEILERLDRARLAFVEALEASDHEAFEQARGDEAETVRRIVERTIDDVNFYFGRLVSRALNLPQPPCLGRAQISSLREGVMSFQVAHRRFSNLLHDLLPEDLEKDTSDPELGSYTLRQTLELTAAQYNQRAQQLRAFSA
ncbi:MAG TPA: hypothetical protein VMR52_02315 [Dehalococcoidia bacterium]|nr:hypothetical protein [Dehalococcoidia bacterium]